MENCDYDLFARMDFISRLQAVVSAAEGILKERAALGSDKVPLAEAFFTTMELHSILISSSTVFLGDSPLPSAHVLLGQIVDTCLSEGVFAPLCVPHEVGALRTQSRGGGIFYFEDALYLHSVVLRLAFGMCTLSAPRRCAVVSPMPLVAIPLGGTVAVSPGVAKALGRSDSLPPSSGTDEGSLGNTDSAHGSVGGSYSRTASNSPSPSQSLKQADHPRMSRRSLRSLPQNAAHGESVSLRDTSCSPSPEPVARGESAVAEDSARAVGGDGVYMYASEANHMRRGRAPHGSQPHRALACSQFMLTGRCSFGSRCRYFHDASSGHPSGVAFGTAVPQPPVQHLVAEAPYFTGLLTPCGDARSRKAPYNECEGAARSRVLIPRDSTGDATYIAGVPRSVFPVASLG